MSPRITLGSVLAIGASIVACSSFSASVDMTASEETADSGHPVLTTFEGVDADSGDGSDAADAEKKDSSSESDGGVGSDASDSGGPQDSGSTSPTNLITNGDFETGNCQPWTKNTVTTTATTTYRNGAYSCRVCGSNSGWSMFEEIPVAGLPVGTTFDFDVWMHAPDQGGNPAGASCKLEVFANYNSLGGPPEESVGAPSTSALWSNCHLSITLTAAQVVSGASLRAVVIGGSSGCLLADDAVLTQR